MRNKTVTVDVDVDIDVDQFETDELIEELNRRGYAVVKGIENLDFNREDYDYLIEMIDKQEGSWYTNRIRDKLFIARHE